MPQLFFSDVKLPEKTTAILSAPSHPVNTRAGIVLAIENGRFMVTLNGFSGDYPPGKLDEFLAFIKTLRTREIYNAIKDATLASPIHAFRKDSNVFRFYEKLSSWPKGLLVIGDAIASQNPIYAQGMTCAAIQALNVVENLNKKDFFEIQKLNQRVALGPWRNAEIEDARWEKTGGAKKSPILNKMTDLFMVGATVDTSLSRAFLRQLHMVDEPKDIIKPGLITKLVTKGLKSSQQDDAKMPS